jgi:hypothetical protein
MPPPASQQLTGGEQCCLAVSRQRRGGGQDRCIRGAACQARSAAHAGADCRAAAQTEACSRTCHAPHASSHAAVLLALVAGRPAPASPAGWRACMDRHAQSSSAPARDAGGCRPAPTAQESRPPCMLSCVTPPDHACGERGSGSPGCLPRTGPSMNICIGIQQRLCTLRDGALLRSLRLLTGSRRRAAAPSHTSGTQAQAWRTLCKAPPRRPATS